MKQNTGLSFKWIVIAAVLVLILALPLVVFADNLINNVIIGGTDTFTAPGSTTIGYRINATGGDGQMGCNASDGTPAMVTLSVPAGVTASTTSLNFTVCNVFQNVTFSSSTPGNYAINVSSIADAGTGSYSNQANFTLHVLAPPNTPPSISVTGVTNSASYESGAVPAAGCSVTDAEDGNSTFPATLSAISGPLAAYGLGSQTASCSYTDGGGLNASASATYSIVDTIAPVITFVSRTPANGNGWNNGDVTVNWSCADSGSGVVAAGISQTVSAEGANQSATGTCEDHAGNTASDTQSGINIDKTAPSNISFVGGISNGDQYYYGFVPAAPTCTADGAISGLASCTVSGYSNAKGGPYTLTATAVDNAGNQDTATISYTVVGWTLSGFYNPVDMTPASATTVWNTVKNGSTVPLKFEVFAASELTSTSIVKQPLKATQMQCTGGSEDSIELVASGGTSLRYDEVSGQFIYNWQTPKGKAGYCYIVTVEMQDGSSLVAYFKLK